jgi:cell shape-determining protein MreC
VGGRLSEGAQQGVAKGGLVVSRRLDRGAREALARGEPVLMAAGLVGTVDEVGPITSSVRLITHPKSSLMVQVVARRGSQWLAGPGGVANGTPDGRSLKVLCIPKGADVQPGDFLVTSPSQEATLPPYLIVGRVTRAELKLAAPFYEVDADPRVAPDEAREVYVLTPGK